MTELAGFVAVAALTGLASGTARNHPDVFRSFVHRMQVGRYLYLSVAAVFLIFPAGKNAWKNMHENYKRVVAENRQSQEAIAEQRIAAARLAAPFETTLVVPTAGFTYVVHGDPAHRCVVFTPRHAPSNIPSYRVIYTYISGRKDTLTYKRGQKDAWLAPSGIPKAYTFENLDGTPLSLVASDKPLPIGS